MSFAAAADLEKRDADVAGQLHVSMFRCMQRPSIDMGGKLGVVSVYEQKRRWPLKDDAAASADTQDDCFSLLHNAFSYVLKPQPDGSSAVLWTQHVGGVDVPQDQLSRDTLQRLQDWWQKQQAEKEREKELQKIEATIAYLSKAPDRGAVVGTPEDEQKERIRIEEEKKTIEKKENKVKEEKKDVAQLAAAASERDHKEQAQISHKLDQLKHEQVCNGTQAVLVI